MKNTKYRFDPYMKVEYPHIDWYPDSFDSDHEPVDGAFYIKFSEDCSLKVDDNVDEKDIHKAIEILSTLRNENDE